MSGKRKLKGSPLCAAEMNLTMYDAMDPDNIPLSAEEIKKFRSYFLPIKYTTPPGKIIIFGTGGQTDEGSFNKLWKEDIDKH